MQFESFAHVPLTDEVLAHIWEGEPGDPRKGGHRFGLGREGKTEFPEHWTLEMMSQAVRITLNTPQFIAVAGPFTRCSRIVKRVLVRVQLSKQSGADVVTSAYPVCGDDVFLNVRGRRISVPLDMLKGLD